MTSSRMKESSPQFCRLLYPLAKPPTFPMWYKIQVTNGRYDLLVGPHHLSRMVKEYCRIKGVIVRYDTFPVPCDRSLGWKG